MPKPTIALMTNRVPKFGANALRNPKIAVRMVAAIKPTRRPNYAIMTNQYYNFGWIG
jgi:hypothetical protein